MVPSVAWLIAFGVTCLVEVPLFVLGCRALGWIGRPGSLDARRRLRWWQAVLLGLGLNLCSHPVLWLVASRLPAETYLGWLLVAEAGVVLGEALLTRLVVGRDLGWAALLCLGTNGASLVTGSLLG